MKKIRWQYVIGLIVVVGLSIRAKLSSQDELAVVTPTEKRTSANVSFPESSASVAIPVAVKMVALQQQSSPSSASKDTTAVSALYSVRDWNPPPPPPEVPLPPPKPTAPPLPFQYVGKLLEPGQPLRVFLSNGDNTLTVQEGAKVGDSYVVEKLTPEEVIFVYLPLQQRQTLSFGVNG